MRYFIDTEYLWLPRHGTGGLLQPISVGIVAEDGREYYAVSEEYFPEYCDDFVRANVLPALGDDPAKTEHRIAGEIKAFIGDDHPEFWGDYSAFDYVVLSMLMGGFEDWPEGWPMHINDLQQDAIPGVASAVPHNALADARAVRDAWNHAFQVTP